MWVIRCPVTSTQNSARRVVSTECLLNVGGLPSPSYLSSCTLNLFSTKPTCKFVLKSPIIKKRPPLSPQVLGFSALSLLHLTAKLLPQGVHSTSLSPLCHLPLTLSPLQPASGSTRPLPSRSSMTSPLSNTNSSNVTVLQGVTRLPTPFS